MPNNRPIKKIEECLDKTKFSVGKIKTQDCLPSGDFPIIDQGKDLVAGYSNDESLVYNGNLPVIIYGDHTNIVKYVDFPFICGADGTKVFRFKKDIDTRFFIYLLEFYKPETQGYRRHYLLLKAIDFPLPPLATQKLIVAKLDEAFAKLDESITLTKENITRLDEATKSVLDKVFEEGEWEKKKIKDLLEKTDTWNPSDKPNENFDYIDISSVDNKKFSIIETKNILGKDAPSRAKKILEIGDVIYATTRPNLKNIALCEINKPNLTCSTGFCVLRTKKKELFNKYLFYYIITDGFFKKIEKYIRGAQYPAVSDKDLKELEIPLPPLSKQQEIVTYLDQIFAETKQLKTEYETKLSQLKELKSSILQSAFEGKLI